MVTDEMTNVNRFLMNNIKYLIKRINNIMQQLRTGDGCAGQDFAA